jgi:hypothetical protein
MMLKTILSTLAVGALAGCSGSVAGIGGGNDSGTGSDAGADSMVMTGPTAAQAASDAANAYCALVETCAPAYLTLGMGDVATCQTAFAANVMALFGANGAPITPADVEACAQAIPNVSCSDILSRKSSPACRFMGTLPDGSACASDAQCSGGRCRVPGGAVCGSCGSHSAPGGACSVDDDCADGTHCASSACVAYGQEGSSCDAGHACRPDLGCKSGTCAAPSPAGTACKDSSECDSLHGVFCNPTTTMCETTTFAPSGQACGLVSGALTLCRGPQGLCTGAVAPKYQGTCAAASPQGGACDATNGPTCGAFMVCVNGSCATSTPNACK